jgi:MFS superfamily sulfate permease-like transporter
MASIKSAGFVGPRGGDVLAGMSLAGLLLPEAVAYAGIGNMPPHAGVIGLLVGLLVYGLIGGSRFAAVSATSSSAAVLFASAWPLSGGQAAQYGVLAAGMVLLTGGLFVLGALAKVGAVSALIAKPVLRGFTFGLALVIIIKQAPKMVGLALHAGDAQATLLSLLWAWRQWYLPSLLVGLLALAAMVVGRRVMAPWPTALTVMLLGIAAHRLGWLSRWDIATVGQIQLAYAGPQWPDLARAQWLRLGEMAVAMVLILYAESYGGIRTLALKHGDDVQPNREWMALGLANVLSGLFSGMPVGAGYSATMANEAAGAQSRWAGLCAWAFSAAIIATCLPWVAEMPEPILAAIVIYAVGHMLSPRVFKPYFDWHRDRLVALSAVAAVWYLGVLDGLLASIAISLFMTLRGLAQARVVVLGRLGQSHDFVDVRLSPAAIRDERFLILRPEAPLFFGNVESLMGQVRSAWQQHPHARTLILSLEESPNLDGSSVEALQELSATVAKDGRQLILARLKNPAFVVLQRVEWVHTRLTVLSIDEAVKLATDTAQAS